MDTTLEEENPFRMPPPHELFSLRDREREERKAIKEASQDKPIWLRHTNKSLLSQKVSSLFSTSESEHPESPIEDDISRVRREAAEAVMTAAKGEKESISEFLDKKREMFLANLSLQCKQMETSKLENQLKQRETKLVSQNEKLKQQSAELEVLIQESDRKAVQAIKEASDQSRTKSGKIHELKRLQNMVNQFRSEKLILEEKLADYSAYKQFLLGLTPNDYIETKKKELGTENVDELPLYFTSPHQLLSIFSELEDRNLFLIQNCQEKEEELDALKTKCSQHESNFLAQKDQMDAQIEELQRLVDIEEEKCTSLEAKLSINTDEGLSVDGQFLQSVQQKVVDIHSLVIGHDGPKKGSKNAETQRNVGTLRLLTDLESLVDQLLTSMAEIPHNVLKKAQKQQEKERRERQRQELLEKAKVEKEKRIQDVLKRATAPPKKKTGKPVMFRSYIKKKEEKKGKDEKDDVSTQNIDLMDDPTYSDFWS
ncbi:hypothetical protein P9112_008247 [Eukaryota sp. TZLM1-RC]